MWRLRSVQRGLPLAFFLWLGFMSVSPAVPKGAGLPNLVPWPPLEIQIAPADEHEADPNPPPALRFSVAVENLGAYSLEVRGLPRGLDDLLGTPARRQANQCIGWLDRLCTETTPVGELVYHAAPGHDHWHFEDFALYELRSVLADETPDLTEEGLVSPARKASFCLLDDRRARGMGSGNPLMDQYGLYWRCDEKRQGISPGWADAYGWELEGQQIPLTDIPDGTYVLVITANPLGRLLETSRDDNVSWTVIDILAGGTRVIEH